VQPDSKCFWPDNQLIDAVVTDETNRSCIALRFDFNDLIDTKTLNR